MHTPAKIETGSTRGLLAMFLMAASLAAVVACSHDLPDEEIAAPVTPAQLASSPSPPPGPPPPELPPGDSCSDEAGVCSGVCPESCSCQSSADGCTCVSDDPDPTRRWNPCATGD